MIHEGMTIHDVRYDAAQRCYHGAITIYGDRGTVETRVSAFGPPNWGYEKTLDALAKAGLACETSQHSPA